MRRTIKALGAISTMVLLGVLLGALTSGPANADETAAKKKAPGIAVGLRPATKDGGDTSRSVLEYEIPPRGKIVDYIAISNIRTTPVTVRIFAKDATTTTDTPYAVQESDQIPTDIGSWMSLKKDRITLPPRSETVVPFQLGVPFNAAPGDHAGAIVVSLLAKEPKPQGGTIVVDHRVGLRVLARVPGDYRAELSVSDLKASWGGPGSPLGRGDAVVTYTVRNTGNLRVSSTQDLQLIRVLGLPAVEVKGPAIPEIQPGGEIEVRQVVPDVFGTGPMKASVSLHPVPVDPRLKDIPMKHVTATTSFPAWPWLLAAIILGLLVLSWAGWRFERRRRRSRNAAKTPTGGRYRAPIDPDARPAGKRVLVRALVAAGGILTVLSATPAQADGAVDVWQAKASIGQGTDNTPFDILTTGGCPLPGTNAVAFAFGRGFPKEGGSVVGNGDAGVEARGAFRMPLVSSMQQLVAMQPAPAPLAGDYRIELRCVTPGLEKTTGKYVFAIRFTDPHHWKALPPLTTAKGPVTTGPADPADTSGDPTDGAAPGKHAAPGTNATPGSGESSSAAEQEAAAARAQQLAGLQDPSKASEESHPDWWLIGGGVAVLAASGALYFRRSQA